MIGGRRGDLLAAALGWRTRWALAWAFGGTLASFVAAWWLDELGALLVGALLSAIGLALLIEGMIAAWASRDDGWRALLVALPALAGVLVFVALVSPAVRGGSHAPGWWLLHRHADALRAALRGGPLQVGVLGVARDGRRTAFLTRNGVLGNWSALVHAPAGAAPGMFRTRHQRCVRLDAGWLHCHFG